jgi:hypothetical protein
MEARVAGRSNDPLAGLGGADGGVATLDPPAQEAAAPFAPQEPQPAAPSYAPPAPQASAAPFGQAPQSARPKRKNPGRLIGGRMDEAFSARFDQLHLELKSRLSNPSLSVDTVVAVILERVLAEAEVDIGSLEQAVRVHQAAKIQQRR